MRARSRALSAMCLAAATLAGCGGSGEGLDSNGRPIGSGSAGTGPLTADFTSIQDHVFTPICTVCHAGAGAPQGLRLDAANSYSLLVGVPSTEVASILRVAPGNPDNSYVIQKLEGHASVGARMPFGGPYLDAATIAVIRQWITDGAKRSAAAVATRTFAMAVATPAAGDVLAEAPARLVVEFTSEFDAAMVNLNALRLERMDSTREGARASVVAADVAVPIANPRALLVTPRVSLVPGHYRLFWSEAFGTHLSDVAGQRAAVPPRGAAAQTLTEFDVEVAP